MMTDDSWDSLSPLNGGPPDKCRFFKRKHKAGTVYTLEGKSHTSREMSLLFYLMCALIGGFNCIFQQVFSDYLEMGYFMSLQINRQT